MKIPFLLLLLVLAVCGGRSADGEVNASLENSTSRPEISTFVGKGENLTQEVEEEEEEEEEEEGRMPQEDQDVETIEGTEGKKKEETSSSERRLAAVRLPSPEALQGGRHGRSRQGTPQVLPGLHLSRIPPTCALCSRERNLCRIISGIFTRSPLPYGYSLVTPVPAGVCNLTITEMKPSKNFFALRRSDGTYVLNGNWDIQAEGEYLAAGTTFFYTPSDEDRGEQLSAPGPLKEPIDFMLISQSPNPGIKYEYRVPLPEYLGGNPTRLGPPATPSGGLGLQTGGLRPNAGGSGLGHGAANPNPGPLTPFQPQGNPNANPRNPNYRIRNPNIGGVNPGVPGMFPYGSGNTGGGIRPINPVLTPVGSPGKVNYNTSGVSFPPPLGSQGSVGVDSAGSSPSRNPPYPGVSLDPSTGPRNPSGIPGVPTRSQQPITPLGSTTKTTGTLPLPWAPTYGSQEGGRGGGGGVPLGTPFVPGQQYPRVPGGGGGGGTPVQRFPAQVRPDGPRLEGSSGHDSSSSRDAGFPPEFPKNSVPLRPIPIPRPGSTPGGRRTPGEVSSSHHHRRLLPEVATSGIPADTEHRTRHQHGSKPGRRKGTGKPPDFPSVFDSGVQLTQPNATPSASSGNRTVPVSTPRRRGKGGRRRHHQQQEGVHVGGKRRRKDRRGRHRKQGSRFQWAEKGFTPCSKSCGGGNKTVILSCERRRNKKVVPDRRCSHLPDRPEKRSAMCNLTPCPAAWLPEEWGPCSVTCGMGVQTRQLVCKQVVSPTLTMMVPEGACLSPPTVTTSQVCEMPRCNSSTPEWEAESWGNCSAPCGLGTRTRQVKCLVAGVPDSEEPCDASAKPQEEQVCDMGSCATNTWFFSKWAQECSESCGTGIQTRRVHCLAEGDDFEDQCPSSSRPDASRPCRGERGCGGQWFVGPWDGCSADCGAGRESRPVLCVVFNGERWRVTQDSHCKLEFKPQDSRECNFRPCTPEWYTSEWSQCSASCDGGIRRREVTCLDVNQRQSADCLNATKPDKRQPCGIQPCGFQPSMTAIPAQTTTNHTLYGDVDVTVTSDDLWVDVTDDGDAVTERPDEGDVTDDETHREEEEEDEEEVNATEEEDSVQEGEEEEEEEEEEENELVVEETTGSALNVIPDKDAQGDESVSDDEDEERDKKEEEEETKKKRKRNKEKKKKKKKNEDRQDEDGSKASEGRKKKESIATDRPVCIDRIKNCHLVFRARLCRLKYYNKLCCRTCSNT